MPNTYKLISSFTSSSNSGTVTFSSIPQTYTDLIIHIYGQEIDTVLGVNSLRMYFNDVQGTSYSSEYWRYNEGTTQTAHLTSRSAIDTMLFPTAKFPNSSQFGAYTVYIPNYSNSSFIKTVSAHGGMGAKFVNGRVNSYVGGLFNSTSAISSVTFNTINEFAAGSIFTVYGILKA